MANIAKLDTVFVLGAGFSFEQGYPLARNMKENVLSFLCRERHVRYWEWMQPWNGGYEKGQFYAGLEMIERNDDLPFEELLLKLARRLKEGNGGPCHQTNEVLRIGARRRLWEIHNSVKKVNPAYRNFAGWLRSDWQRYGIISLNWDLQVERLLQEANVPWHYCPTAQGRLTIIKPHGSINWNRYRQEDLNALYLAWEPVARGSKLSFDPQQPLSDPDESEILANLRYLIFPGDPDQPDSHEDLKLLWDDASSLIHRAEKIVFVGYSFPEYDCHSREVFADRCRGKKIVVINPSKRDLRKFSRILGADIEFREEKFSDCLYAQLLADT